MVTQKFEKKNFTLVRFFSVFSHINKIPRGNYVQVQTLTMHLRLNNRNIYDFHFYPQLQSNIPFGKFTENVPESPRNLHTLLILLNCSFGKVIVRVNVATIYQLLFQLIRLQTRR